MQEYEYKAKTKDGVAQEGMVEAESEYAAAKVLSSKDLIATKIKSKSDAGLGFFKKLSTKDKAFFMRQLATTINAGLPISQALKVLQKQTKNKKLSKMIEQITNDVEAGTSLSQALAAFPESFSKIDITLIESGETSGTLDKVLIRSANTVENDYKLKKKVRSALAYPGFVMVVVVGVLVIMTVYVLPQMSSLYSSFNAKLPLLTRIIMAFSKNFPIIAVVAAIVGVVAYFGLRYLIKVNRNARKAFDKLKLSIPIFKLFLKNLYLSRMTRTLEGLVASGVSIIEALKITANAVGNALYEDSLNDLAEDVKSGKPMSEPMKSQEIYPPIVSQMISVGEQTGEMDTMLGNLADYFEEEVDNFVKSLTSIIEPLLIVVMAGIVGVMLVAIMLPIYQFGGIINK